MVSARSTVSIARTTPGAETPLASKARFLGQVWLAWGNSGPDHPE